jgi:hypothetical protein
VPDADREEPNDQGEMHRIGVVVGGTLAGTPLARCLEEELQRTVLAASLPARVRSAVLYARFDFPPAAPGPVSSTSR